MAKVRNHKTFIDDRGSFTPIDLQCGPESVNKWLQANISVNPEKFTFRGMHYQAFETAQNKYVKVIQGKIIDFLYDLETKEVEWYELNDQEAIFVPKTKAHGFLTLKDDTRVVYKVDKFYSKKNDKGYNINDKFIKVKISKKKFILSNKDSNLPFFSEKI